MSDRASFSRDLAQALREAEERPSLDAAAADPSVAEELLHRTYQRLCHDDPVAVTDAGARLLQAALLDPESPYALSPRLVQGVRHWCNKNNACNTAATTSNAAQ